MTLAVRIARLLFFVGTLLLAGRASAWTDFEYTPPPTALRGTVNGVAIAIDIRSRQDQMGSYIQLAMLQQTDPTHWNYIGNAPVHGRAPDPALGNAGQVWEIATSSITSYRSPEMAAPDTADALVILNARAPTMISDWVPKMNAILSATFTPGRISPSVKVVPPRSQSPTFKTTQEGREYLARSLGGFALKGLQIVAKPGR